MKKFLFIVGVFAIHLVASAQYHGEKVSEKPVLPGNIKISYPDGNPLKDALQPVPETAVFKMEGYYLWDPSVIKVGDTYHLFCSRWPKDTEMKGWLKSHVIRATSKSLFGPYQFQEVVLEPSKHPWATQGVHNPKITKVGDKYLIYHLVIPQWKTGFALANSIQGPWSPVYGNQGGEASSIIRKGDWKLIHYYEDGHNELYNLRTDISETRDVSGNNQKLVSLLHQELFDYLHEVGARFPEKDPEYSAEGERKYLDGIVKTRLPQLEEQRLKFLSKDFDPENNWWGSEIVEK